MNSLLVNQSGGKWHWMVIEWPEVYTLNRLEVVDRVTLTCYKQVLDGQPFAPCIRKLDVK